MTHSSQFSSYRYDLGTMPNALRPLRGVVVPSQRPPAPWFSRLVCNYRCVSPSSQDSPGSASCTRVNGRQGEARNFLTLMGSQPVQIEISTSGSTFRFRTWPLVRSVRNSCKRTDTDSRHAVGARKGGGDKVTRTSASELVRWRFEVSGSTAAGVCPGLLCADRKIGENARFPRSPTVEGARCGRL